MTNNIVRGVCETRTELYVNIYNNSFYNIEHIHNIIYILYTAILNNDKYIYIYIICNIPSEAFIMYILYE